MWDDQMPSAALPRIVRGEKSRIESPVRYSPPGGENLSLATPDRDRAGTCIFMKWRKPFMRQKRRKGKNAQKART